jgi:putative ABC transport system permease protein
MKFLSLQLAYKNLVGAGLRTWLNVSVLSFAFVIIIFYNGMIDGWNQQARKDTITWEYGFGHLLNQNYDPYDPFTLQDGHGILTHRATKELVPLLIQQGTLYPAGRMVPVMLKGIDPDQEILKIPSRLFKGRDEKIPALIGKRMAASLKLKKGDQVLLRWRDRNGTFDAGNITIINVFNNNVPTVDSGQIWIPIQKLWEMTDLKDHATLFIAKKEYQDSDIPGWQFKDQNALLKMLDEMIAMKKVGGSIMYILLLALALLAIFDTQVLSVFRRQREIGTYIALGMTRLQVVGLFSMEGTMNSFLATLLGSLYGIPLLAYFSKTGIGVPNQDAADDMGISIAERIFPVYGAGLIITTIAVVVISATIVSFLPAKKIAKMDPVDALKGKIQ